MQPIRKTMPIYMQINEQIKFTQNYSYYFFMIIQNINIKSQQNQVAHEIINTVKKESLFTKIQAILKLNKLETKMQSIKSNANQFLAYIKSIFKYNEQLNNLNFNDKVFTIRLLLKILQYFLKIHIQFQINLIKIEDLLLNIINLIWSISEHRLFVIFSKYIFQALNYCQDFYESLWSNLTAFDQSQFLDKNYEKLQFEFQEIKQQKKRMIINKITLLVVKSLIDLKSPELQANLVRLLKWKCLDTNYLQQIMTIYQDKIVEESRILKIISYVGILEVFIKNGKKLLQKYLLNLSEILIIKCINGNSLSKEQNSLISKITKVIIQLNIKIPNCETFKLFIMFFINFQGKENYEHLGQIILHYYDIKHIDSFFQSIAKFYTKSNKEIIAVTFSLLYKAIKLLNFKQIEKYFEMLVTYKQYILLFCEKNQEFILKKILYQLYLSNVKLFAILENKRLVELCLNTQLLHKFHHSNSQKFLLNQLQTFLIQIFVQQNFVDKYRFQLPTNYYLQIIQHLLGYLKTGSMQQTVKKLMNIFNKLNNYVDDKNQAMQQLHCIETLVYIMNRNIEKCKNVQICHFIVKKVLKSNIFLNQDITYFNIFRLIIKGYKEFLKIAPQPEIVKYKQIFMIVYEKIYSILKLNTKSANSQKIMTIVTKITFLILKNQQIFQLEQFDTFKIIKKEVENHLNQIELKYYSYFIEQEIFKTLIKHKKLELEEHQIEYLKCLINLNYCTYLKRIAKLQKQSKYQQYMYYYEFNVIIINNLKTINKNKNTGGVLEQLIVLIQNSLYYENKFSALQFFMHLEENQISNFSISTILNIYAKILTIMTQRKLNKELNLEREFEQTCMNLQKVLKYLFKLQNKINQMITYNKSLLGIHFGVVKSIQSLQFIDIMSILKNIQFLMSMAEIISVNTLLKKLIQLKLSILTHSTTDFLFEMVPTDHQIVLLECLAHYPNDSSECLKQKIVSCLNSIKIQFVFSAKSLKLYYILKFKFSRSIDGLNPLKAFSQKLTTNQLKIIYLIFNPPESLDTRIEIIKIISSYIWKISRGNIQNVIAQENLNYHKFYDDDLFKITKNKLTCPIKDFDQSQLIQLFNLEFNFQQFCTKQLFYYFHQTIQFIRIKNQRSKLKTIIKGALLYSIKYYDITLTLQLMKQMIKNKENELFNISTVYDIITNLFRYIGIQQINADSIEDLRNKIFIKRKSLPKKFNLKKLQTSLSQIFCNNNSFGFVTAFQSLLLNYYQALFNCNEFETYLYCKQEKIMSPLQQRIVEQKNKKSHKLEDLIELNHQIKSQIINESNYINAWMLKQLYAQNYFEIQKILETIPDQSKPSNSLIRQYLIKKNLNLLEMVVYLMDFNYEYKYRSHTTKKFKLEEFSYQNQQQEHQTTHSNKIQSILHILANSKDYPIIILFPFGDRLMNINLTKIISVTFTSYFNFADNYSILTNLISKNELEMRDTTKKASDWWRQRDRVNRQVGKIVHLTDIGDISMKHPWNENIKLPQMLRRQYKIQYLELCEYTKKIFCLNSQKYSKYLKAYLKQNLYYLNLTPGERDEFYKESILIHNKFEENNNVDQVQQNPVLLIVWDQISNFPYEELFHLYQHNGIYRIPSFRYFLDQAHRLSKISINVQELSYLINPSLDLVQTEDVFRRLYKQHPKWKGIIGKIPDKNQFQALLSNNIFLYMGHGAGTKYAEDSDIFTKKLQSNLLLFGCSSAKMIFGNSEAHGTSFKYLMNGCPIVLGCLWDVTDKDIDKFTQRFFRKIDCQQKQISFLVESNKKKCRLEYLNGAALVVYGIPTKFYSI